MKGVYIMLNSGLQLLLSRQTQLLNEQEMTRSLSLLALFIVAVIMLFWGKKLLHVILFLFGLIGGLIVGVMTAPYWGLSGVQLAVYCLVFALLGAIIFSVALALSFFLAGNVLGYLAFTSLKAILPLAWQATWCLLICCLLCGVIAAALKEQAIAVFAAFTGSLLILDILFALIFDQAALTFVRKGFQILDNATALIAVILLLTLTVLGSLYQLGKIKVRN